MKTKNYRAELGGFEERSKSVRFVSYSVGQTVTAAIKKVRIEGLVLNVAGIRSAIMSTCAFGYGRSRVEAISQLRSGDQVIGRVVGYYPETSQMTLEFVSFPKQNACKRKTDYKPIPQGTVFLWDVANLFGKIGPEDAAWRLGSIARSLETQGYRSLFFIERRSLTWAMHNQLSASDAAALDEFARRDDFSVVADGGKGRRDEADCTILQVAEAIPNSVCVSHDHYGDYAKAHPGIVGTERVRSFTVSRLDGKLMISVSGLKRAIVVEPQSDEVVGDPQAATAQETIGVSVAEAVVEERHTGLFAVADEYARRGDAKNAERVYSKVAKKNPAAYEALADMYREGVGVSADLKKAVRYERLAIEIEKRNRERSIRECRRHALALRGGGGFGGHFSVKRQAELSFRNLVETQCLANDYRRAKRSVIDCAA